MKSKYLLPLISCFLIQTFGLSQVSQGNDPCGCNIAVAINGVYNYRYKRNDNESRKYFSTFFKSLSYEEFQTIANNSGSGSFSDLSSEFGLSVSMKEEQFYQKRNELESYNEYESMDIGSNEFYEKFGDENVLNAWVECKKVCKETGLIIWTSESTGNEFILNVTYNPGRGMSERKPVIRRAYIKNGRTIRSVKEGELIQRRKKLNYGENEFSFTRVNSNDAVTIDLEFQSSWGNRAIVLPKDIPGIDEVADGCQTKRHVVSRKYRFNVNDPSENDGIDIPVDGANRKWYPDSPNDKFGEEVIKVEFLQGFPHGEQYEIRNVSPHPELKNQILFEVKLKNMERNNLTKGTFDVEVQIVYEQCE